MLIFTNAVGRGPRVSLAPARRTGTATEPADAPRTGRICWPPQFHACRQRARKLLHLVQQPSSSRSPTRAEVVIFVVFGLAAGCLRCSSCTAAPVPLATNNGSSSSPPSKPLPLPPLTTTLYRVVRATDDASSYACSSVLYHHHHQPPHNIGIYSYKYLSCTTQAQQARL